MATIMCLPQEVIIIILGYNDISIEDIINFKCVCKQFMWAVKCNSFLEKKLSQRWPMAKKHYDKLSKKNEQEESQENKEKGAKILNFMKKGNNCVKQLDMLTYMTINEDFYTKRLESQFKHRIGLNRHLLAILPMMSEPETQTKILFLIDEINYSLAQSLQRANYDLAKRYCNVKLLNYLRGFLVDKKWNKFYKRPLRQQLLERSATIVAQELQPQKDVSYSRVKASLDTIALEVLIYLTEKHPDHSIFSLSTKIFSDWEKNNIDDNHWNEAEGTQIMDTLEEYIFGKLNFRLPKTRTTKVEYKCIDNVLETKIGGEKILFIIYQSVARRLGLHCNIASADLIPISIFWQPNKFSENVRYFWIKSGTKENKYPDCLHKVHCFISDLVYYNSLSATKILEHPEEPTSFGSMLEDINIHSCHKIKSRSQEVKFAVGMIVTHGDQSTDNSIGVIVGWHRININVDREILQEFSKNCSHFVSPTKSRSNHSAAKQQIYYAIFSDNNETCCVEEDAVTLTTPKWIDNDQIYRYFSRFENTHYVPNEMLAKIYPQDAAITARTLSKN
ncbi:F-box only protein 21-like [Polyergus mexicanus]|uniref:F-box only protein 21-like n=1 Tax=Polyergus mexicanus TaxID=615972 RepID=UPI0038B60A7F